MRTRPASWSSAGVRWCRRPRVHWQTAVPVPHVMRSRRTVCPVAECCCESVPGARVWAGCCPRAPESAQSRLRRKMLMRQPRLLGIRMPATLLRPGRCIRRESSSGPSERRASCSRQSECPAGISRRGAQLSSSLLPCVDGPTLPPLCTCRCGCTNVCRAVGETGGLGGDVARERCKTTGGDRRTGCRCPVEGCAVCRLTSRERSEQAGGGSRSFDDVVRSDINRALNRAAARGLEGFAVLGEVQVADLQLAVGNAIQRFLVAEGDG